MRFSAPKASSRGSRFVVMAVSTEQVKAVRQKLNTLLDSTHANPILIRLAWHDSGSYSADAKDEPWPKPGGATASIRFKPELGKSTLFWKRSSNATGKKA